MTIGAIPSTMFCTYRPRSNDSIGRSAAPTPSTFVRCRMTHPTANTGSASSPSRIGRRTRPMSVHTTNANAMGMESVALYPKIAANSPPTISAIGQRAESFQARTRRHSSSAIASAVVLLPKLVAQEWHGGVGSYGLLFTLQGIGMVLGSVVLAQTAPARRRGVLIYWLFFVNSALGVLIGLSPSYWGAAVVQIGRGFCIGFAITLWDTMLMQLVPQHMLSRVISMDWFGSIGLLPAGLGLWALLSGLAPPGTLIAASSAFCALLFLLGLADRRIRSVD